MTDSENELQPISKTKLKASADALQDLGVKLLDLPDSKLAVLDLPETLLLAIQEGRKIRANGALRRHRQYIGTLMLEELKYIDKVAYIRFASVYQNFENISDFNHMLEELGKNSDE